MVAMVNKATKRKIWVAENRVEEYKAGGYELPAIIVNEVPLVVEKPKKAKVKKESR